MLDEQLIICRRCGYQEFIPADKRKKISPYCKDCKREPAKSISYGLKKPCRPWDQGFDEDDNPMLNGVLYMPGKRVCGHRDCCESSHILSD